MILLFFNILLFSTPTQNDKNIEYIELAKFFRKKICVNYYSGRKECVKLNKSKVYIYRQTQGNENYLSYRSQEKEFQVLHQNFEVFNLIDSLAGDSIPNCFFNCLNLELEKKADSADIVLAISPIFYFKDAHYCITEMIDAFGKKWVIKFKFVNGVIKKHNITVLSQGSG